MADTPETTRRTGARGPAAGARRGSRRAAAPAPQDESAAPDRAPEDTAPTDAEPTDPGVRVPGRERPHARPGSPGSAGSGRATGDRHAASGDAGERDTGSDNAGSRDADDGDVGDWDTGGRDTGSRDARSGATAAGDTARRDATAAGRDSTAPGPGRSMSGAGSQPDGTGPDVGRPPPRPVLAAPRTPEPPLTDGDGRTHLVENQPPPITGYDALGCDLALAAAVEREGAGEALPSLERLAATVASDAAREHARLANEHSPVLRTHDRWGHRIDEVEFHPSWHWLMRTSVASGLHATPWVAEPGSGAHVARAAGFYLMGQLEQGHCCPVSMTYAAVPALRHDQVLATVYEPGLRSTTYDFGLAEPLGKRGLLAGMSMTEKQGGSDVRANSTQAVSAGNGTYVLTGHKWFTSAPMNDLFLTLAQTRKGVTCFVLPRVLPDGTRNGIRLMRLKDKLGNRSNASAELEYVDAVGWRLGDEGRGIATIIDMVSMTRLDCVLGSASVIRAALTEAAHHVAHRSAFGERLADTPLMQTVIADLALESEAATTLALRLAGAADRRESDLLRLALPAAKYLVCKRAPTVVAEALECLGGNGFVEESGLPRLYREAPLNSIWEGSGNVTALDVLRAVTREPDAVEAVLAEIDAAAHADTWFDRASRELRTELRSREPRRARRLAELLALCLQGSLLLRYAPTEVSSAFVSSRFLPDGPWRTAGTLPAEAHAAELLERVTPRPRS